MDNKITALTIEQQISALMKNLKDSYQLFINARDSLANISFVDINEKLKIDTTVAENLQCNQMDFFDSVTNNTIKNYINTLNQKITNSVQATEPNTNNNNRNNINIPELNTFFRIVNTLQDGIRKMEKNHEILSELNNTIVDAVKTINQNSIKIQEQIMDITKIETV